MAKLKFTGDISIQEILNDNQLQIYNAMLESIKLSYHDDAIDSVHIIDICINDFNHSIKLSRQKFIKALSQALKSYEDIEAYEKCQECLNIINYLKKNNNEFQSER